jgi:hypothetical protein
VVSAARQENPNSLAVADASSRTKELRRSRARRNSAREGQTSTIDFFLSFVHPIEFPVQFPSHPQRGRVNLGL